ncbi:unnamed protein product [Lactuca virosa]|uniref:Uncharacterized protein n=1 Tax=Lactuca virosa TaxID=75947 RepID=A0AAU9LRW2_9ASTR|nr:unnamed protein product [Lactuca virosa]
MAYGDGLVFGLGFLKLDRKSERCMLSWPVKEGREPDCYNEQRYVVKFDPISEQFRASLQLWQSFRWTKLNGRAKLGNQNSSL